jgi:subtilisin-like proprotein convertase family protein
MRRNFTRLFLTGFIVWLTSATAIAQQEQQLQAPTAVEKVARKAIKKVKNKKESKQKEGEEKDKYDGPALAEQFQIDRTKNPFTGEVPAGKMWDAVEKTKQQKAIINYSANRVAALSWAERGSNSDVVGPSNGNTRSNNAKTSGRIDAIMVDSSDATHKTVWVGGRDGGLWKTTDITKAPANWTLINDYFGNLSVSAITQDPTNYNTMYFCTGASFLEGAAVRGNGVFKSTDHGVTWSLLASTASYFYCSRILCDYLGNVYLGTRGNGLLRSTNGGSSWTDITPAGLSGNICDLEITSTAVASRLHLVTGIFSTQAYRFTDIAATVTSTFGWTAPVTPFPSYAMRAEIGVSGNTLYAAPADGSLQVPTIYKSGDGGVNWTATAGQPTTGWASGQGWYALTVVINPSNPNECFVGGLDQNKTTDGGATWTRASFWVGTTGQYVHADQHKALWYDGGSKLIFGCDGGVHFSSDGGTTITDRNEGLRLKQFYSCAIHPDAVGFPNYFLAGAQDNGTHQFNGAGLASSVEVTGGDGAYVSIDQNEPQYQIAAYVFSNYRRTTNGGATWLYGPSNNSGQFINPFDYDNANNKVYSSYTAGQYLRWENPQSGFTYTAVPVANFNGATVSAVTSSSYTANRVYFGTNGGRVVMADNANAAPTTVNLTPAGMIGYVNAVVIGASDQYLAACITSYGVNNIWVSTNGGTSWTACDGNLPDMPVYSAFFSPVDNNRLYIATETGVWETASLNGAKTIWAPHSSFPTVRATMLRYRSADRTLLASTYGRGLWTAELCASAAVTAQPASTTVCVGTPVNFSITAAGETTLNYQWQLSTNGGSTWANISGATTNNYSLGAVAATDNGKKFRCYVTNSCPSSDTSAAATLTAATGSTGGTLSPASVNACAGPNSTTLTLTGYTGNILNWESSTDGGIIWNSIATTNAVLTVTNVTQTTLYRANVQSTGCTASFSAPATVTFVPVGIGPIFVSADNSTILCAGNPTRLTVQSAASAVAVMNNNPTSVNGYVLFNFKNNNAFPVTITNIASVANVAGTTKVSAYYNTTALTGVAAPITIANGWNQFGAATINAIGGVVQPFMAGLSLVIPAGATYAMAVSATDATGTAGNFVYSNTLSTPVASAGGCDIITNNTIGMAGGLIPSAPITLRRFFVGSITISGAPAPLPGGTTFTWSPAAGLNATNTNPVAASPGVTTNYTVVASNGSGCTSTASATILVNQRPVITEQPVNTTACSGTAAKFIIDAKGSGTNGIGVTYQWQQSTDSGFTYNNLANTAGIYSGVTTSTLNIIATSAMNNNRYRCVVSGICSPNAISTGAVLSVAASPVISVTPLAGCGGISGTNGFKLVASAGVAINYIWTPATGLFTDAAATIPYVAGSFKDSVYAAPNVTTTYTVIGNNPVTGCNSNMATATVNYTPVAPTVNPATAAMCLGNEAVPLTITSSLLPVTKTFSSGAINIPILDNNPAGTAPSILNVTGIPAGAVISKIAVKLNITHTYIADMSINLKAPNGVVLNLSRNLTATGNGGANFTNTIISSDGTNLLKNGSAPFTNIFKADAINGAITTGYTHSDPTGYVATAASFSDLFSTANGNWTLAMADDGANDVGTFNNWSIDITYGVASSGVWIPNGTGSGLFTDAAATIPYTGTDLNTVYAKPTASTTYAVVVNTGTCGSAAKQVPITVNIPVKVTTPPVDTASCTNNTASFTVKTTGTVASHNWQVSTTTANGPWANITNGAVYGGANTATLTLKAPPSIMNGYFYRDSVAGTAPCGFDTSSAAKLTVYILPVVTISAKPGKLFPGLKTIINAAIVPNTATAYTWLKSGAIITGAASASLQLDINKLGDYSVRVKDINGCVVTSNILLVTDSASSKVFVYPSPNSGQFQVRYYSGLNNTDLPRGLNIYNAKGERILTKTYSIGSPYARMDVDLTNHGTGIYTIEVVDVNGNRLAMGRTEIIR